MRKTALVCMLAFASLSVAGPPLAEGEWTKKTASISGSWSIVDEGGSRFLVLSDDFKTKKAPDLKLFLSTRDLSTLDGNNATSHAVLIAKLKSARGGQRYPIPDGIDLDEHSTLLLHCEKYAKLWGGAAILDKGPATGRSDTEPRPTPPGRTGSRRASRTPGALPRRVR